MRELDELLLRYLERYYDDGDERQKAAFEALLALPDPQLVGYLLKREAPEEPAIAAIVGCILLQDPAE